ncbi:MAG: polysaccharide deacetylase family protein [Flavobacteriales bacterium]|nr:polysaccharide deacetylase family protein [Flavobacteriales bacterium]
MRKIDLLNLVFVLGLIVMIYSQVSAFACIVLVLMYLSILTLVSSQIGLNFFVNALNRNTKTDKKIISLTFDDGPDPYTTPQILDVLKEFKVKAAFFVIGKKLDANPELLHRIENEGHLIGNHSFNHELTFPLKSPHKIVDEINKTSSKIMEILGKYPICFRPPFGVTNPRIAKAVQKTEVSVVGWNIRSLDTTVKNPEITLKRMVSKLKPGSVVLLHDTIPDTVKVLKDFLVLLKRHDYEVVLPDKLFGIRWYDV